MYFGEATYDSYFEGEDVKLYRHEYEAELRRVERIDSLLKSLTPADATKPLFTYWERSWFDIPWNHQPRPRE